MPYPLFNSSRSSNGDNTRSVNPAAYSAGQKRFPGRAKWWPTAAVYSPGLIPEKRTRRFGAITSRTVLSVAARSCSFVGFHGFGTDEVNRRRSEFDGLYSVSTLDRSKSLATDNGRARDHSKGSLRRKGFARDREP